MNCTACSCENDPCCAACRSCGAPLRAVATVRSDRDDGVLAARVAEVERRLAELACHFAATGALRAAPLGTTPQAVDATHVDLGDYRITFGTPSGARLELRSADGESGGTLVDELAPAPSIGGTVARSPLADAAAAIWAAFDSGAPAVHVEGPAGAGATALLAVVAAQAPERGFADGVLMRTDVAGPAGDVAARLTRDGRRLHADARALVLLDRSALDPADLGALLRLLPQCRFVITGPTAYLAAATVALRPLSTGETVALLESITGRAIDPDNARVGIEIAKTVGLWPGPVRLIAVAARELGRSFISLRLAYDAGPAILRALVANCSPDAERILAGMAAVGTPLSAAQIAYVSGAANVGPALARLQTCELVAATPDGLYELPGFIAADAAALDDVAGAFVRAGDVFAAGLEPGSPSPLSARQLAGAIAYLRAALDAGQAARVVTLGPPLAQAFALRGAAGAWARVLALVEAAASKTSDRVALDRARHDLGVATLVAGDSSRATNLLRSVLRERRAAGEADAAAATAAALALAENAPAATGADSEPRVPPVGAPPPRPPVAEAANVEAPAVAGAGQPRPLVGALRMPNTQLLLLFALALAAVVVTAVALRPHADETLTIATFTAQPPTVVPGAAADLCVQAANAAVVEIFPNSQRLPANGRNCITVRPASTTTYVAVATSLAGEQARSDATVDVADATGPAPAIAAFGAFPARIKPGQSTRLCYAVTSASLLRMVPRVGPLTRLHACQTVTLRAAHRYAYRLYATDDNGRIAVRVAHVDVVANRRPAKHPRGGDPGLARRAVYQFDATPTVVDRGQAASLCVGVGRPARAYVTHVGALSPGITRCYRVTPASTTVYRLYVALPRAQTVESVTIAVRAGRRHEVARLEHR